MEYKCNRTVIVRGGGSPRGRANERCEASRVSPPSPLEKLKGLRPFNLRQHRTKTIFWILHTSYLHLFRHIAQIVLARRQPCVVLIVQSDEKSDCAIRAQSLCGITLMLSLLLLIVKYGGNFFRPDLTLLFAKRTFYGQIKCPRNLRDFRGVFVRKSVRESMFGKSPFYRRIDCQYKCNTIMRKIF